MKKIIVIVTALTWLGMGNIVSAKELLPWKTEGIEIVSTGVYSVKIDERVVFFYIPADLPTQAGRATEVISRGDKYEDWLKRNGEYEKSCFAMGWNFYPLGIPLFGSSAQFSISAKLHVKNSPARRDSPTLHALVPDYLAWNVDRGDFSKPEELFENLKRTTLIPGHSTPVEEVIINNRKWYHYFRNSALYPDDLEEYYVTGLAPDRYLEITIRQYPVPVTATRYPTYPTEDQRPGWMKKTHKYKEQVINSLRITQPEGSKEPDLYDVETLTPAPTERPIPQP
jgi:hypothetical protein